MLKLNLMQDIPLKKHSDLLKINFWDIFFAIVIASIVVFISFKNYIPETFLSGWDNLHPEFNFKLNIERSLNAAWQEYQGVGLLGGMAHASDLPRQAILFLVSYIVPVSFIRYLWTFLMLFVGPLGAYFFIRYIFKERLAGFAGALFYLLNLATVQFFLTSFDSFVSFYGFFPWLIFSAVKYIDMGKKNDLLLLFLVSLLSTPAFYVQTFFVVYAVFLVLFASEVAIRRRKKGLLRLFTLGTIVFCVNAFWLLPAGAYALTQSRNLSISRQNSIATPDTRYFNEARGDFKNIASFKGFWFDYRDYQNGTFEEVIKESDWKSTTAFFWITALGFFVGIFAKKSLIRFSPIILFAISYLMLSGGYLSFNIPIVSEMFRSIFTKWSVPFALLFSLGMASLVRGKYVKIVSAGAITALIIYFSLPVFNGKLIYPEIQKNVPEAYFDLFEFFKNKPKEARIMTLPINSIWGWDFHDWEGRGSGFIWYGIAQPILHRSFDVWSRHNESFYLEASNALYGEDINAFKKVLKKYQVRYLLLDESVINAGGDSDILYIDEIKTLASILGFQEAYKSGFLTVYDTGISTNKFISAPREYVLINADQTYSGMDPVYEKYGDYVFDPNGISFPFSNLDKRMGVAISSEDGIIVLRNSAANSEVRVPASNIIKESFGENRGIETPFNCDLKKLGEVEKERTNAGITYRAENGGVSCDYFDYPSLSHSQSYILRVKGENKEGRSLKIYLQNWKTNRMDAEELLPEGRFDEYYLIQKKENSDLGYSINLETRSFGRIPSKNTIEAIEFYPVDIDFITSLYIDPKIDIYQKSSLEVKSVEKWGTAIYKIEASGSGLLELGQGYEDGWIAVKLENSKTTTLSHLKVNSWANGWRVENADSPIYIIFWPQLLEWGGFALTGLLFVLILRIKAQITL